MTFSASGSAAAFVPGFMMVFGLWVLIQTVAGMLAAWRTVYAVTDRRVIIMEQRSKVRIGSWAASALNTIGRLDRQDGHGDIVFNRTSERQDTFAHRGVFIDIANHREVERLIRDLTPEPT